MNNSINCSGFVEMFVDSSDDFDPYGYSALDAEKEQAQIIATNINDSGYKFPSE